jgi:hypothetical protein
MRVSSLRLRISYSQYTLEGGGWDPDLVPYAGGNGLVWGTNAAAVVMTGLDSGHVPVTFGVGDKAPALDLDSWDDVVEVSVMITDGRLMVCSPPGDHLDEVPIPKAEQEAHAYRVRVHARGRDAGREAEFIDADEGQEMVEEYQVLFWPAPLAPELRYKLTDEVGAEIRARV